MMSRLRFWHWLRVTDYTTEISVDEYVKDQPEFEAALTKATGVDTQEHQIYLKARSIYLQKWYRFILREPKWVDPGGTIYLQAGAYLNSKNLPNNTAFIGEPGYKTVIKEK